jgi:transposase
MFKPHVQGQDLLFPPRIGDLIPQDELCRVVSEAVDRLELSGFSANYSPLGQRAVSPHTLLKLLLYGYAQGVRSSRALEGRASYDVRYMWLAGEDRPSKSTIAEFRRRNLSQLEEVFVQVVRLCAQLGMLRFGHWSIDGSKVKANAAKGARRKQQAIEAELIPLREEIRKALAEAEAADRQDDEEPRLPPSLRRKQDREQRLEQALERLKQDPRRKRANTTDPDAPTMKRKGGGFEPSYNTQLTVDADSQVVVAADVSDAHTDGAQLIPQLDQAIENARGKPEEASADAGYGNGLNLQQLEQREVTGYIPPLEDTNRRKSTGEPPLQRQDFRYEPEQDRFICPAARDAGFAMNSIGVGDEVAGVFGDHGLQGLQALGLEAFHGFATASQDRDQNVAAA